MNSKRNLADKQLTLYDTECDTSDTNSDNDEIANYQIDAGNFYHIYILILKQPWLRAISDQYYAWHKKYATDARILKSVIFVISNAARKKLFSQGKKVVTIFVSGCWTKIITRNLQYLINF